MPQIGVSNSPSSLLGHGWQPGGAETTRNKKLDLLHRLVFERHRNLWVQMCLVARTPFFWNITQRLPPPVPYPRPRRPKKWERICVTFNKRYRAQEEKKNYIFKLLLMSCSRIWLKFLMFGHSNVTALLLRHALEDSYKPSSQLKVIEDCIQFSHLHFDNIKSRTKPSEVLPEWNKNYQTTCFSSNNSPLCLTLSSTPILVYLLYL